LGEAVEAAGCRITAARLTRADGRMLSAVTDEVYAAAGAPAVALHRGTLQRVLLGALPGEGPRCGREATGYEPRPDGVTLRFADGEAAEGALLVGADGLRSAVRAQLLADGEPRYAGYTSWRGVAGTRDGVGAAATEVWGRGRRLGLVPIDGDRTYWYATHNASADGRDNSGLARELLLRLFHGWPPPIRGVLLATPRDAILRTDIHDRPKAGRWGEGRITLLGDAAHPMTPDLGQGACQAIEDAVVLARALCESGGSGDPVPALRRYEAARAPRASAVVVASRRLGAVGQAEGIVTCRVRDALMSLAPAGLVRRQVLAAWVFPGRSWASARVW
ncbi:MAG TPA: FAD-dependent monooxygenase, partial [Vicinamibacteria bacterium]|nr:FAD-dependent monooxygenase [Vicinamibacteria bacterium]